MHFGLACVALPSNLGSGYVVHPLHTLSLRQNENISKDVPREYASSITFWIISTGTRVVERVTFVFSPLQ